MSGIEVRPIRPIREGANRRGKRLPSQKKKEGQASCRRGYHTVTPYLACGDAASAIEFYKAVATVIRIPGPGGKISREVRIGDSRVMLTDEYAEMDFLGPRSRCFLHIHLYVKDVDAMVERAVAAGAKLLRAVKDQFYGDPPARSRIRTATCSTSPPRKISRWPRCPGAASRPRRKRAGLKRLGVPVGSGRRGRLGARRGARGGRSSMSHCSVNAGGRSRSARPSRSCSCRCGRTPPPIQAPKNEPTWWLRNTTP